MRVTIENLCKAFDRLPVLRHISMELVSGQIYCLMGPSGSGKTTFLRILMGLETPDAGSVRMMASDTSQPPDQTIRISAVFQEDRLCEQFTPVENVMMVTGRQLTRAQVFEELSRLLPEESLNRPVSTLSGGMKRRTAICRALLADYDLLLMDEPFTGLDDETRQLVIDYILEKTPGKLVILSTHQEHDIEALGARLLKLPE